MTFLLLLAASRLRDPESGRRILAVLGQEVPLWLVVGLVLLAAVLVAKGIAFVEGRYATKDWVDQLERQWLRDSARQEKMLDALDRLTAAIVKRSVRQEAESDTTALVRKKEKEEGR